MFKGANLIQAAKRQNGGYLEVCVGGRGDLWPQGEGAGVDLWPGGVKKGLLQLANALFLHWRCLHGYVHFVKLHLAIYSYGLFTILLTSIKS